MEKKEKQAIYYFLSWIIIGILICFVGISNVFASEYNITDLQIQGYDNTGSSLTNSSTACYNGEYCEMQLTTVAGSYGGAIGIQSPIPILPNHSYAISLKIYVDTNANIALSKKNRIALGSSLGSAKYSYETNQFGNSLTYSTVNNNILQFVISSYSENAESYLLIPFTTNNTTTAIFTVTSITIDDLGENNLTQEQIETSLNNQTNDLINNQNQNTQDIIDSNKETQDVIKDQFNTCRESYNLVNPVGISKSQNGLTFVNEGNGIFSITGTAQYATGFSITDLSTYPINLESGKSYTQKVYVLDGNLNFSITTAIKKTDGTNQYDFIVNNQTRQVTYNTNISIYNVYVAAGLTVNARFKVMLQEGSIAKDYEPYGEEICSNKLDQAEETRKGIWATIKNLPNAFMDMLKGLFIPDDGYFEEWFNKLKLFFEEKLGFLVTPFTIIIDFVNRYLQLNPNEDIIINIPDITVPNFEEHIIVNATTFNWSELLRSKESLDLLWELYLSFVDVFLILNFIGLCETKYNRIFGGDTTPYEYYTTEDSYMYDTDTGEITKMGVHKEKRTTRKKVT